MGVKINTIYFLFYILLKGTRIHITVMCTAITIFNIFLIDHLIHSTVNASVLTNKQTMICEFCERSKCAEPTVTECALPSEGKRSHCFVLWKIENNGNLTINMKVRVFFLFFYFFMYMALSMRIICLEKSRLELCSIVK